MAREVERREGGGVRVAHAAVTAGVAVVGVLVAFWALGAIAGFLWGLVKLGVVLAAVAGVVWLLAGRRR